MQWWPGCLVLACGCGLVLDVDVDDPDDARAGVDSSAGDASRSDAPGAPDGDDGADGAAVDGGEPVEPPGCGGPSALFDDFDDGVQSPFWLSSSGLTGTVEETGGTVRMTPDARTMGAAGIYVSSLGYDALRDRVSVEVLRVSSTPSVQTILALVGESDLAVGIVHDSGTLVAWDGEVVGSAPYVPAMHRWWQLRTDGSTVFFEVSSDGAGFVPFATKPMVPGWLEGAHVEIGTFALAAVGSPDYAEMDNLNLDPGRVHTTYCPAQTFSDSFDGTGLDPTRWIALPECAPTQSGGTLRIPRWMGLAAPCGVGTRHGYVLEGSAAVFERDPSTPPEDWIVGLSDAGGALLSASCGFGQVEIRSGSTANSTSPCPTERFWSLDVRSGAVWLSVSADGAVWTDLIEITPTELDTTVLRAGVGSTPLQPASVESYNLVAR